MPKTINLTKGYKAIVDDADFEELYRHKWCACIKPNRVYAQRRAWNKISGYIVYMHRQILNFPEGSVDHINLNCLDNRRLNLRVASKSQNAQNCRPRKRKYGKFKGTERNKKSWSARIRINGKRLYLGSYKTEKLAALAYDKAAYKYYGVNAYKNFKKELA